MTKNCDGGTKAMVKSGNWTRSGSSLCRSVNLGQRVTDLVSELGHISLPHCLLPDYN